MATRLARFETGLSELRHIPADEHVRAAIDGKIAVDSRRAVLLREPQRRPAPRRRPALPAAAPSDGRDHDPAQRHHLLVVPARTEV